MLKSRMLTDNEVRRIAEDSLQFKAFAETLGDIIPDYALSLTNAKKIPFRPDYSSSTDCNPSIVRIW